MARSTRAAHIAAVNVSPTDVLVTASVLVAVGLSFFVSASAGLVWGVMGGYTVRLILIV
jgi:hypothetical protein